MAECPQLLRGKVARYTELDSCGAVVVGGDYVVAKFIEVARKRNYDDGPEFFQRDAWGDACLNIPPSCPVQKPQGLEIKDCTVDLDKVVMTTGSRANNGGSASEIIGWVENSVPDCANFSLEVWQEVTGAACDDDTPIWMYHLWPWLTNGKLMDDAIKFGPYEFGITAIAREVGSSLVGTGGPWDILSVTLAEGDLYANELTTEQPPEAVCGAQVLVA